MRTTDLTVIKALNRKYFEPEITAGDFPVGMAGELKSSLNELDNNNSSAVLLITDNTNLIRAFVNRRLENGYSVYIGDPSEIESAFDRVTDIWSPFDGGALLKKRYKLLIDYIRCRTECRKSQEAAANKKQPGTAPGKKQV